MITNQFDSLTIDFPEKALFRKLTSNLLDPFATDLAREVKWISLKRFSDISNIESANSSESDFYPVVITGEGPPLILLHGFDSSFLEFRRLVPLLRKYHQLVIPDLFGFGFCPRPFGVTYGPESLVKHVENLMNKIFPPETRFGVIGASMGGAVAMELARRYPEKIQRLLLLAPAGLTGKPMPLPPGLDQLGVWFLRRTFVRRSLCRQAFSDPQRSVGEPEDQIASLHLSVPGWGRALRAFARSGGMADCGTPIPPQPVNVIFGDDDRILSLSIRNEVHALFSPNTEEVPNCGHLPHIDCPDFVAKRWFELYRSL